MYQKLQERKELVLIAILGVWWGLAKIFNGKLTLELPMADNTPFTSWVGSGASAISGNRTTSPFFIYFFNPIRLSINSFVDSIRNLISTPLHGGSSPVIGWAGLVALLAFAAYATSRIRIAILVVVLVVTCGALGMWVDTMDTPGRG